MSSAFIGCTALYKLIAPKLAVLPSFGTFSGCTSLTTLNLPVTVTTIGRNVFSNSSLQHVYFEGKSLEEVKAMANFSRWGLQESQIKTVAFRDYVDSQLSSKADISSVPTKISDLSNDAGFITSADIHNDYIEDINGSSISADLGFVAVTQLSGIWQLSYGVSTNTLHGQSKTNMSYYPANPGLGDNAFQLTWGVHSSEYWTLEVYEYIGSWSRTEQYDSEAATSAATELVFSNTPVQECVYEEPRIVETGKLATQEWVLEQLSVLGDIETILEAL